MLAVGSSLADLLAHLGYQGEPTVQADGSTVDPSEYTLSEITEIPGHANEISQENTAARIAE
jgi:hypothetical protein